MISKFLTREAVCQAYILNRIPLIFELSIDDPENRSVKGQICGYPEGWCEPWAFQVNGPSTSFELPQLVLDSGYFRSLTEMEDGFLEVVLYDRSGQELEKKRQQIRLLPIDHWDGLSGLEQILAAWVTPNDPALNPILKEASKVLEKTTQSGALDGYQRGSSERVWYQMSAVWQIVAGKLWIYMNPPAHFDRSGQRIRMADHMLQEQMGTCLDFTLLFASLLEQIGLHPLILLHEGHAYAGCWLTEKSFGTSCVDSLLKIRKYEELQELIVFETTLACSQGVIEFSQASIAAKPHLLEDRIFQLCLDVKSARREGILPLGRLKVPSGRVSSGIEQQDDSIALSRPHFREIKVAAGNKNSTTRFDIWKNKLLDLSLRNRLLNFHPSKQTLEIKGTSLDVLEDYLAQQKVFQIEGPGGPLLETDSRKRPSPEEYELRESYLKQELKEGRLRTDFDDNERIKRLTNLYRLAHNQLEETGSNVLYIALGFIHWEEKDKGKKVRSPVLLVPVKLIRKSARENYRLQRLDDDTLVNTTLLEYLRSHFQLEINGLEPPPTDDNGVDVQGVFDIISRAILGISGWELRKEASIGLFSFNKFVLWRDLQDKEKIIREHSLVKGLIEGDRSYFGKQLPDDDYNYDEQNIKWNDPWCPVSADASQLNAVKASLDGYSYVLFGPPGTGKSQTITNIIASNLAIGKRVLFVAEKKAALEVVSSRLEKVGLGPFCLELHSHKGGKGEVLKQISASLENANPTEQEGLTIIGERWDALRNRLAKIADCLHAKSPIGESVFNLASLSMKRPLAGEYKNAFPPVSFSRQQLCSSDSIGELTILAEAIPDKFEGVGLTKDLWESFKKWSPNIKESSDVEVMAMELVKSAEVLHDSVQMLLEELNRFLPTEYDPIHTYCHCSSLIDLLETNAPTSDPYFLSLSDVSSKKLYLDLKSCWERFVKARNTLDAIYEWERFTPQDLDRWAASYRDAMASFFSFLKVRPIRKEISAYLKLEFLRETPNLEELIVSLKEFFCAKDAFEAIRSDWGFYSGEWNDGATILQWWEEAELYRVKFQKEAKKPQCSRLLANIQLPHHDLARVLKELKQVEEQLHQWFFSWNKIWGLPNSLNGKKLNGLLDSIQTECQTFSELKGSINALIQWQEYAKELKNKGLSRIIESYMETGSLPVDVHHQLSREFWKANIETSLLDNNFSLPFRFQEAESWIQQLEDSDQNLRQMLPKALGKELTDKIKFSLSKKEAQFRSEINLLRREIAKKTRHKPVRILLRDAGNVIRNLKPCFLMSPLSVAQYLDLESDSFDLVVFDEASQIPVWDAIGTFARAKKAIVVGDPKQLPPTSFFSASSGIETDWDTEEADTTEDMESILDELIASNFDQIHLRWHYRSKKEGLIDFSNHHYYDSRLLTFPAPSAQDSGVHYVSVPDGVYEKGGSRTNRREAECLIQELFRRLHDPVHSQKTIGIVTFSQAQQVLIQDLIDIKRRDFPELDPFFDTEQVDETVFVKNLENIQGDERDVILFSICYGPDNKGNISMNFGPLNKPGGERRLNVAITRARWEVVIFSTLRSEQIDLKRTRALGAAHLKAYLEYAERKGNTVGKKSFLKSESTLSEHIKSILEEEGYTVSCNVGNSNCRLDLAVHDKENVGQFMLGIELDGPYWKNISSVRDREILRPQVFRSLGWRLRREWSLEWIANPAECRANLIAALRQIEQTPSVLLDTEPSSTPFKNSVNNADPCDSQAHQSLSPALPKKPLRAASKISTLGSHPSREIFYPEPLEFVTIPSQSFYEGSESQQAIRSTLSKIIEHEGPIEESLLFRRCAQVFCIKSVGSRVKERFNQSLPPECHVTEENDRRFFWPSSLKPEEYFLYRIADPINPSTKRSFDQIPNIEVRNALRAVKEHFPTLSPLEWTPKIAERLGVKRISAAIREKIEVAIMEDPSDFI